MVLVSHSLSPPPPHFLSVFLSNLTFSTSYPSVISFRYFFFLPHPSSSDSVLIFRGFSPDDFSSLLFLHFPRIFILSSFLIVPALFFLSFRFPHFSPSTFHFLPQSILLSFYLFNFRSFPAFFPLSLSCLLSSFRNFQEFFLSSIPRILVCSLPISVIIKPPI